MTNLSFDEALKILVKLRESIPAMVCLPECTSCCGHVAMSEFEFNLLPPEARKSFNQFSFKCSFCSGGRCTIHNSRFIICRLFGVSEKMECPEGIIPPRILTKKETNDIMKIYIDLFFGGIDKVESKEVIE